MANDPRSASSSKSNRRTRQRRRENKAQQARAPILRSLTSSWQLSSFATSRLRVYQCNKGRTELSTVWLEMPKQRSSGTKPRRRDPAATRNKLLTAARREFAESGLAGARV